MGKVGTLWVELGLNTTGFGRSLSDIDKATKQIGTAIADVGKKMTIAGAAITGALGLVIKRTSDLGHEFFEMSEKTGISAETLSALKLAADTSGTSIGNVSRGLRFLSDEMVKTSTAGDKSKTVLGLLGIQAVDSEGQMRPLNDVLLDVADRFSRMEDGAIKVKTAVELFGRAGMELIPFLNLGKKGLEENIEAAKKLGIVFTDEDAKSCNDFHDSITKLQLAFGGVFKQIAMEMIPALKGFAEKAADAIGNVIDWSKKNPALVETIGKLALVIGGAGGILVFMGPLLFSVGQLLKLLPLLTTGFSGLIGPIGLAAAAAGLLAISLYKLRQEEKEEAEYLHGAGIEMRKQSIDVMDLAAKKAGLTADAYDKLLKKYGDDAQGLKISVMFGKEELISKKNLADATEEYGKKLEKQKKVMKDVGDIFPPLINATKTLKEELNLSFQSDTLDRIAKIQKALKLYKDELPENETRALKNESRLLWDEYITGGLLTGALAQRFKTELKPEIINVTETITETALPAARAWNQALLDQIPILRELTETESIVFQTIEGIYGDFCTKTLDAFYQWGEGSKGIIEGLGDAFESVGKTAIKAVENMVAGILQESMKEILTAEAVAIAHVIKSVMASIPFPLNLALVGGAIAAVSALFHKIKLAEGGIVTRPTFAMIGEKGPEAVVPLTRYPNFENALAQESPGRGYRQPAYLHADIYIGNNKIDEQIVKVVEKKSKRRELDLIGARVG